MRSSIAAAALVLVGACGGSRPPTEQPNLDFPDAAPPPQPDAEPATAPVDAAPTGPTTFKLPDNPVVVTLVKKGKGKATPLRYAYADGSAQIVDASLDVGIVIGAGGKQEQQTAPTQTIGRVVEVTGVDANGTARVKITMDRGSAADAQMTETLETLKGTVLEATIDARGRLGEVSVTSIAPDLAGASTLAGLINFHGDPIVLPDEPIGTGGTWKVVSHDNINGIESDVTTTYKLTKRTATAWTITGTIESSAAPQTIPAEAIGAAPGSGTIDVKSMAGKGTLTVTIDPTRPGVTAQYKEKYDAVMAVSGQEVQISSTIDARQTSRPKQ